MSILLPPPPPPLPFSPSSPSTPSPPPPFTPLLSTSLPPNLHISLEALISIELHDVPLPPPSFFHPLSPPPFSPSFLPPPFHLLLSNIMNFNFTLFLFLLEGPLYHNNCSSCVITAVMLDGYGGKINSYLSNHTAFPHRYPLSFSPPPPLSLFSSSHPPTPPLHFLSRSLLSCLMIM